MAERVAPVSSRLQDDMAKVAQPTEKPEKLCENKTMIYPD